MLQDAEELHARVVVDTLAWTGLASILVGSHLLEQGPEYSEMVCPSIIMLPCAKALVMVCMLSRGGGVHALKRLLWSVSL